MIDYVVTYITYSNYDKGVYIPVGFGEVGVCRRCRCCYLWVVTTPLYKPFANLEWCFFSLLCFHLIALMCKFLLCFLLDRVFKLSPCKPFLSVVVLCLLFCLLYCSVLSCAVLLCCPLEVVSLVVTFE